MRQWLDPAPVAAQSISPDAVQHASNVFNRSMAPVGPRSIVGPRICILWVFVVGVVVHDSHLQLA